MKQLLLISCLFLNLVSSCQSDGGSSNDTGEINGLEKVTYTVVFQKVC